MGPLQQIWDPHVIGPFRETLGRPAGRGLPPTCRFGRQVGRPARTANHLPFGFFSQIVTHTTATLRRAVGVERSGAEEEATAAAAAALPSSLVDILKY
ncbi:hypothetical protein GUJ93_ZPchr0011g28730 [Zizania palustris]|uniref:Uncharacterized protein n=1 Tax=Zizania palustris TaxID=103762 RepID=A0A8J5WHE4_ZIZPA|nr:hypothetical protein GUJ93_ZPchr0011g28730 [Zizania palustris]